jgi:chemotaxis response regulator CheB
VPADGFSFVRWHEEFGPDQGQKKCPFDVVKSETTALIERTRAIMKRYQAAGATDPVPEPKPAITWKPGETGVDEIHGTKVLRMMLEATLKRRTQPRVSANPKAKSYGSALEKNAKIVIVGSLDSGWGFFDDGKGAFPRVYLKGTLPRVPLPRDAS